MGFAAVILIGSVLLILPVSVRPGVKVHYIDALFTSTSAVCVTGLIAIDAFDNFTVFGQVVLAALIQIGGLGVSSVGVGLVLAAGKRVSFHGRLLVKEALNVDTFQGMVKLVKWVLLVTLCFEGAGAILSFISFSQDYPLPRAIWTSIFHSVAAFNNSGFDILGGMQNLIPYQSDILLNLTTCALIIFGGIGFLVILDVVRARSFRKLNLHSKVVISTTAALLIIGTLLLKATEDMSWLGAFFHSVSARTAGFSTYSMGELTNAGLFVLILLMFIGASPGSTGGGIKTTTFFALMQEVWAIFTKRRPGAVPPHAARGDAGQVRRRGASQYARRMRRNVPALHPGARYRLHTPPVRGGLRLRHRGALHGHNPRPDGRQQGCAHTHDVRRAPGSLHSGVHLDKPR